MSQILDSHFLPVPCLPPRVISACSRPQPAHHSMHHSSDHEEPSDGPAARDQAGPHGRPDSPRADRPPTRRAWRPHVIGGKRQAYGNPFAAGQGSSRGGSQGGGGGGQGRGQAGASAESGTPVGHRAGVIMDQHFRSLCYRQHAPQAAARRCISFHVHVHVHVCRSALYVYCMSCVGTVALAARY